MSDLILSASGVRKRFDGRDILKGVSLSLQKGDVVAIIGRSGSGKSTFLRCLAELERIDAGRIEIGGEAMVDTEKNGYEPESRLRVIRRRMGYVFQDFNLLDTFSLKDNIFLPLVLSGKKYPEMEKRLKPIAEKLGIEKLLEKYPYEVSGGQKQRAAIARALITKPQLILADEPSGALDSKAADSLMNLFTTINQEGQTIVMVTHSVKAASSAKRVLFINDGKVFHQLYRGNLTNEEMYERISDTLKILTTGGEEDE